MPAPDFHPEPNAPGLWWLLDNDLPLSAHVFWEPEELEPGDLPLVSADGRLVSEIEDASTQSPRWHGPHPVPSFAPEDGETVEVVTWALVGPDGGYVAEGWSGASYKDALRFLEDNGDPPENYRPFRQVSHIPKSMLAPSSPPTVPGRVSAPSDGEGE
ncbi:hypothetical protein [Alienimonas sp. DA493]|uniref:hypothetical protein n=1 Tax=Alienimonas sp. DA493 TaxID=3373605 RepID=UPI003753F784